jgi:hypothetical protein
MSLITFNTPSINRDTLTNNLKVRKDLVKEHIVKGERKKIKV